MPIYFTKAFLMVYHQPDSGYKIMCELRYSFWKRQKRYSSVVYQQYQVAMELTPCRPLTPWGVVDLYKHWAMKGRRQARRQAITGTNVDAVLVGPLGTNFSGTTVNLNRENAFENAVFRKSTISLRPQCVEMTIRCPSSWECEGLSYSLSDDDSIGQ